MFEEVNVLTHSSIRIEGSKVLYFDPYEVSQEYHDADFIFITHDHYDHFSPKDIEKLTKENTKLVAPECMSKQSTAAPVPAQRCLFMSPGESMETDGLQITAIASYNRLKPFHPKGKKYVGYLVTMDKVTYYIAGDTDMTEEAKAVKCDVALLPAGGKFTMDYKEAAKLANCIKPKLAIPTHYGTVTGSPEDGRKFAELIEDGIEVHVVL